MASKLNKLFYEKSEELYQKELDEFYDSFNDVLKALNSNDKEQMRNAMYNFKRAVKGEYSIFVF